MRLPRIVGSYPDPLSWGKTIAACHARPYMLSLWDGVFANLTGGVFLVGYMLALQASEGQIGLLAAFPLIANVAQLFSTHFLSSFEAGWSPFVVIFFLSAVLRLLALPLLAWIDEPREPSSWEATRVIRNVRAFTIIMGFNLLYHFWLLAKRRR